MLFCAARGTQHHRPPARALSLKVKLKYFLRYMEHQTDDSPLYIFDSHFDDHEVAKGLLEDFSVPRYFPDDLFSLVGERRRPPYR